MAATGTRLAWSDGELAALVRELGGAYAGRTVLVTGGDGFMGSHLVDALVALGARTHVLVRATSSGALNNIAHLRRELVVHWGDLTDRRAVDSAVAALRSASEPPIVFHLGAQAHVGESWLRPYETVQTNVVGTLNLLQSVVDHELELACLSTSGTSEEYGNVDEARRSQHSFDADGALVLHERSPINPKSVYATSKLAADFLTQNFADAYGLPAIVTRMFNNYGPRQNPRYVTGTVITQALEKEQIELGLLDTKRDFCFCADGVRAHLLVALNCEPGAVYCFGQGSNISIGDWVDLILRLGEEDGHWPRREIVSVAGRFRPGASDVMALRADSSLVESQTGWRPLLSWEEGLRRTIAWYAANRDKWRGRVDWLHAQPSALDERSAASR